MNLMKWIILGAVLGAIGGYMSSGNSQPIWGSANFNNSPFNYNNSLMNFDNSPFNYNNSPMNYNNSPMNYGATNGVYDNNGNRIGYTTVTPQGITNIYGNDGNRLGFVPAPVVTSPLVPVR